MDLGRRFLDGFFTAALVFLALSMSSGFVNIINAGTGGFGRLFGVISGQASNPFYKPPQ
jgi:hypothetical protein